MNLSSCDRSRHASMGTESLTSVNLDWAPDEGAKAELKLGHGIAIRCTLEKWDKVVLGACSRMGNRSGAGMAKASSSSGDKCRRLSDANAEEAPQREKCWPSKSLETRNPIYCVKWMGVRGFLCEN